MRQDRCTVSGQKTGPELLVAQCLCYRRQLPRNSAAILPDCRIELRSEGLVLRSRWSNVYGRGSVDGSLVAKRCIPQSERSPLSGAFPTTWPAKLRKFLQTQTRLQRICHLHPSLPFAWSKSDSRSTPGSAVPTI